MNKFVVMLAKMLGHVLMFALVSSGILLLMMVSAIAEGNYGLIFPAVAIVLVYWCLYQFAKSYDKED